MQTQDFQPLPLILPGSLEYMVASWEIPVFPGAMDFVNRTNGECHFICRPGSGGLLEAVTLEEFEEFANDGELDERQDELEEIWAQEDLIFVD